MDTLHQLVDRLRAELERRDDNARTALFETHISLVLLAGDRAWKFKKPLDLGFLDFSTLERRHHYCRREVELNRRYAPGLYLGVVAITGTVDAPSFGGAGAPFEYAVEMQRFADDARLDRALENHALDAADLAAVGETLAAVHAGAPAAPAAESGSADAVGQQIMAAFEGLEHRDDAIALVPRVQARVEARRPAFARRRAQGHVRDCHGDLHLSNLVRLDGAIQAFDCIEFSDALRFIDCASDMAFLLMDLDHRGEHGLANVFLNAYLAAGGDYDGLEVLPLYCIYRTLVRAKVAALAERQDPPDASAEARCRAHLDLAAAYLAPAGRPGLIITHGVSGSGKSWLARRLVERAGFVHLRSDVERKRLAGLDAAARSGAAMNQGIYAPASSDRTYDRLLALARSAVSAGFTTLVDATFLTRARREPFRALAAELDVPFHILLRDAPVAILRERVEARAARGADPSEATVAVLERQLDARERPAGDELAWVVDVSGLDPAADEVVVPTTWGRPRPGLVAER